MQALACSTSGAIPSIVGIASGGLSLPDGQCRAHWGARSQNSDRMQGVRVWKTSPGRGVGVQSPVKSGSLQNRGFGFEPFRNAPPQVLRKQGARFVRKWKAPNASRLDEDPDWERKSSNGSASSSSNGSVAKSVVQEPKPFVARDGTPKPGIVVVSSPGERLSPQDSGFASQLSSDTRPKSSSRAPDYEQPSQSGNGTGASSAERSNGVGEIAFASGPISEQITDAPSCPMPNFATTATRVTLLQPVPLLPSSAQKPGVNKRPLLIYVPGMDGTGQGIRPQIEGLYTDGYDIRCVYIPSNDRSTWGELVDSLVPLIEQAATLAVSDLTSAASLAPLLQYAHGAKDKDVDEAPPLPTRHVTLLAESFGTCLALRVAARAPSLISRLVLLNPATNFDKNNWLVSLAAATGLLAAFPGPLYSFAQDVMLPLLVKRNRVSADANKDLLSPIDYVPAACAAWRLHMLNEGTPSTEELANLKQPVMLFAGAKDRVLPSMNEAARLQTQLPNAWRVILPESGHTALLEDHINIASLMRKNGFSPPRAVSPERTSGGTPRLESPANGPSPPDLTDLAARDPVNPGVVAVNPGVSGAANSENPRVRDAVGSAAEVPAARVRDAHVNADVSRSDVSGLSYDSPVPRRRRAAVPDEVYDEMGRLLEPWRIVTSPLVSGAENLPDPSAEPRRPILFVGNHTIFGLYDSPLLVHELFMRGFRCRGLAHPGHWRSGAGQLFERYGNVKATPFAAYKLLKEGEDVLLFPGGAREVVKRKGEEYQLQWREKADFVRMASRLGAIIVPFGALGGDDAYKILWDGRDILSSPVGPFVEELYKSVGLEADLVYPVTRLPFLGLPIPSPIPIPAIERIYFHFAPAVDTSQYACDLSDADACQDLYGLVRRSVEESIAHLKEVRARDPERMFPARMLAKASRLLPEFSPRE
ncbi:hypothetical protein KFL_002350160 [Klebsormidium nitens]|uniref:Phospholipid/glycerol acyltransferase domain-containing protein n=1 Tax=Klebsormidium nitens TaxID=105231 RepID=A0A1Y1I8H6_KLENI|nr:hypothetical protein KFL_002350160 [Klebsormidium nitens]|eukprot:GAQ85441.1 hypothetical protein KFL_002350160 [Klebsormidium nitens]